MLLRSRKRTSAIMSKPANEQTNEPKSGQASEQANKPTSEQLKTARGPTARDNCSPLCNGIKGYPCLIRNLQKPRQKNKGFVSESSEKGANSWRILRESSANPSHEDVAILLTQGSPWAGSTPDVKIHKFLACNSRSNRWNELVYESSD